MNVLVTGGAGFIGSHVVERLLPERAAVTVLDNFDDFYDPKVKKANAAGFGGHARVVAGDIRERTLVDRVFDEGRFDLVIHLAAKAGVRPSISDPESYLSTNINGTFYLLEAAQRTGVQRFVFASSSSVYGGNTKIPFSETDLIVNSISPYATSKIAGEQLCSNYTHLYGLRTVCLRFFTVYGPRQRPDLAISKFTRLLDEGKAIPRYGDGTTARDYTCVDDIVDGIMAAIHYEGARFDIFNLGGAQATTLNELIAGVETALGKKAVIEALPLQQGDVTVTCADIEKASRLLGYTPRVPVSAGLPRYVAWYLQQRGR